MAEFKPMSISDLFLRELLFKAEQENISIEELACSLVEVTKERNELKKFIERYKDVTDASKKISEESEKAAKEKAPLVFPTVANDMLHIPEESEKVEECKAFQRLEITFKNGETITYNADEWDDYSYNGKAVSVRKNGTWVGLYNFDDVFCVELK